jgi:hypothetical protein
MYWVVAATSKDLKTEMKDWFQGCAIVVVSLKLPSFELMGNDIPLLLAAANGFTSEQVQSKEFGTFGQIAPHERPVDW